MADDWTHQQTDNAGFTDQRNFYKVEKWTKDGLKVDRLLYAGNDLDRARELFREAVAHPIDDPPAVTSVRAMACDRPC
jgi:hypothetical protein